MIIIVVDVILAICCLALPMLVIGVFIRILITRETIPSNNPGSSWEEPKEQEGPKEQEELEEPEEQEEPEGPEEPGLTWYKLQNEMNYRLYMQRREANRHAYELSAKRNVDAYKLRAEERRRQKPPRPAQNRKKAEQPAASKGIAPVRVPTMVAIGAAAPPTAIPPAVVTAPVIVSTRDRNRITAATTRIELATAQAKAAAEAKAATEAKAKAAAEEKAAEAARIATAVKEGTATTAEQLEFAENGLLNADILLASVKNLGDITPFNDFYQGVMSSSETTKSSSETTMSSSETTKSSSETTKSSSEETTVRSSKKTTVRSSEETTVSSSEETTVRSSEGDGWFEWGGTEQPN